MKQTEGIASVLLECEYLVGPQKKPIAVKLGLPSPSENGQEWACKFHLAGLRNSRVQVAYGVDGLQALTIAADAIRKRLDRLRNVTSETEPYEFVFPQVVPMSYGLEFHRYLCEVLRKEIEKKERQLSRKRLARKRPR
jgi:hypothetical protein